MMGRRKRRRHRPFFYESRRRQFALVVLISREYYSLLVCERVCVLFVSRILKSSLAFFQKNISIFLEKKTLPYKTLNIYVETSKKKSTVPPFCLLSLSSSLFTSSRHHQTREEEEEEEEEDNNNNNNNNNKAPLQNVLEKQRQKQNRTHTHTHMDAMRCVKIRPSCVGRLSFSRISLYSAHISIPF